MASKSKRKSPAVTVSDDAWGVVSAYEDNFDEYRETSKETREAIHAAMGVADSPAATAEDVAVQVMRSGETLRVAAPAELTLEDGTRLSIKDKLPSDLPFGYHDLRYLEDGRTVRLIHGPENCWFDDNLRLWGWAVQLYAARSSRSWGLGDLADLADLAGWSRELNAGALLINPLNAVAPGEPQEASPYFPSTRRFRNPLYLAVEDVPGAEEVGGDIETLVQAGRRLNQSREIDRNRVYQLKSAALEQIWRKQRSLDGFDAYCRRGGEGLHAFGTYCVLAEQFGHDWREWPGEYRRIEATAVKRFGDEHAERRRFHCWLQWLLDRQLARAAAVMPLVQDLPIGVAPGGFDAWQWQDVIAQDATVGAPPDVFNAAGQDWGLPPLIPHRLKQRSFEPFIETIRASMRHARGLRIDHVMGLFRLFWIPRGFGPARGAYVRYPSDALLAIVAIESHRAGAWVAGEDLGTVEPHVRQRLNANRMLTYRLMWFEDDPPAEYPVPALAAITTHDLPTVAGLWTGSDFAAQQRIGLQPTETGYQEIRSRLVSATGLPEEADSESAVVAAYQSLAEAPSAVLAVNLDDALAVEERTNMPGTIGQWPNWSMALPKPLEEIKNLELPKRIADGVSGGEVRKA